MAIRALPLPSRKAAMLSFNKRSALPMSPSDRASDDESVRIQLAGEGLVVVVASQIAQGLHDLTHDPARAGFPRQPQSLDSQLVSQGMIGLPIRCPCKSQHCPGNPRAVVECLV